MKSTLKGIRIVWSALFIAAMIYIWLPEQVGVQPKNIDAALYRVFLVLPIAMLGSAVIVRKLTIEKAEPVLRSNPNDQAALQKWRAGQLASVAMCEGIVLYGLVLRFIGATRLQAAPFYVIGIGAMIVFWPREVQ